MMEEKVIAERSIRALSDQNGGDAETDLIAERSFRALSDQNGGDDSAEFDRSAINSRAERSNRALSDQKDPVSLTRTRARALVGWLVDPTIRSRDKNQPTNQPTFVDKHQQLAFNLLVDREVGIDYAVAQILASTLPPLDIYRVVDDWLPERRAGTARPALLKYRLDRIKPSDAPTVTLSPDFRSSELYKRHQLPPEMVVEPERRNYSLESYLNSESSRREYRPSDYHHINGNGDPDS